MNGSRDQPAGEPAETPVPAPLSTSEAACFAICHCTGVRRDTVLRAIADGCTSVESIRRATGACSGCQTCWPELARLLQDVAAGRVPLR